MKLSNVLYWFSALPFFYALRLTLLYFAKRLFFNPSGVFFSQTGEDVIMSNLVTGDRGFYIDVGCHHPIRISNTFLLYLNGWTGINIDANSGLIDTFRKIRRKDIAVLAAVSDTEEEVVYEISAEPAANRIHKKAGDAFQVNGVVMKTSTLNSILEKYLPTGREISFLNIDVEGHELNVLRSLDLNKYPVKVICVEIHGLDLNRAKEHEIVRLLEMHHYRFVGYSLMNAYFARQS